LHRTIGDASQAIGNYNFDVASRALYEFIWGAFCDWYIEMSKSALRSDRRAVAQSVLCHVLDSILRLLHPFTPFVTEEIYQSLREHTGLTPTRAGAESLMVEAYPVADEAWVDPDAERQMDALIEVIRNLRNLRAELQVPPGKPAPAILIADSEASRELLEAEQAHVANLAQCDPVTILPPTSEKPRHAASAVVGDIHLYVPMEGLVDLDKERGRVEKEIEQLVSRIEQTTRRLQDAKFTSRAPAEVVQKERDKVAELQERLSKLQDRRRALE
jgi:valyl-tRNA synthetase